MGSILIVSLKSFRANSKIPKLTNNVPKIEKIKPLLKYELEHFGSSSIALFKSSNAC